MRKRKLSTFCTPAKNEQRQKANFHLVIDINPAIFFLFLILSCVFPALFTDKCVKYYLLKKNLLVIFVNVINEGVYFILDEEHVDPIGVHLLFGSSCYLIFSTVWLPWRVVCMYEWLPGSALRWVVHRWKWGLYERMWRQTRPSIQIVAIKWLFETKKTRRKRKLLRMML